MRDYYDMDLIKRRLDIARMIVKELTGTIDEKDRGDLAFWLEEDERHREEYEELRELLRSKDQAGLEQMYGRQLVEDRWIAVKARTTGKTVRWSTWSKYAAAILLPLMVGIFLFMHENHREEKESVVVAGIDPGSLKARLELADGRMVELGDETRFLIEEIGGTRIFTTDNIVKYTGQDTSRQQSGEQKYNTLVVPRGGEFALELTDGTRVWLNSESRLRYPVHFSGNERKVEMAGEVYFEVAKNEKQPFVVAVNGVDIRVLGTSFNVSAYHEIITTLVEGKVQLTGGKERVILKPDQQAILSDNRFEVKQVEARNYTLWKDGIFYFEDVDLETILDHMARWYNVNIFYVNPSLKTMKFSVEIKRYGDISEILRRIEQTKRVKFEIKDRIINVYE